MKQQMAREHDMWQVWARRKGETEYRHWCDCVAYCDAQQEVRWLGKYEGASAYIVDAR